jgi:hypothetical protein
VWVVLAVETAVSEGEPTMAGEAIYATDTLT